MEEEKYLTVSEAAKLLNVSKQAVHVAIQKKRLKFIQSIKGNTLKCLIAPKAIEEYRSTKYSRTCSLFEGKLLYDKDKGEYSITEAAKFLGIPSQRMYYMIRSGKIKSFKKGRHAVLHIDDIKAYQKESSCN